MGLSHFARARLLFQGGMALWTLVLYAKEVSEDKASLQLSSSLPEDHEKHCIPMFSDAIEIQNTLGQTELFFSYRDGIIDLRVCTDLPDKFMDKFSNYAQYMFDPILVTTGCDANNPTDRAALIAASRMQDTTKSVQDALNTPPTPNGWMWQYGESKFDSGSRCAANFRFLNNAPCNRGKVLAFFKQNSWLRIILSIALAFSGAAQVGGIIIHFRGDKCNEEQKAYSMQSIASFLVVTKSLWTDSEIKMPEEVTTLPYFVLVLAPEILDGIVAPVIFMYGCPASNFKGQIALMVFKILSIAKDCVNFFMARRAKSPVSDCEVQNPVLEYQQYQDDSTAEEESEFDEEEGEHD